LWLSGLELHGRYIRVNLKRTNIKGLSKPKKKKFFQDPATLILNSLLGAINPKKTFKK
jgi:hypothetical protein